MDQGKRQAVRQHPAALRQKVLALCAQPGASVPKIAQAHGLSASLVYGWRQGHRQLLPKSAAVVGFGADAPAAGAFIAVPVQNPPPASAAGHDIRIELRRGDVAVNIAWPVAAGAQCTAWLERWLA